VEYKGYSIPLRSTDAFADSESFSEYHSAARKARAAELVLQAERDAMQRKEDTLRERLTETQHLAAAAEAAAVAAARVADRAERQACELFDLTPQRKSTNGKTFWQQRREEERGAAQVCHDISFSPLSH